MMRRRILSAGFTLIEAIMVITIIGIISAAVAVFIRMPVQGYADSTRRAQLTDAADVAMRRIARDVRLALPNSLRVMNSGGANPIYYIEFIMTRSGGRYRDDADGSDCSTSDCLNFLGDTSFDALGPALDMSANDFIVIFNEGNGLADAYAGGNRAQIQTPGSNVVLTASKIFPFRSPSSRFQVVPGSVRAVTYECPQATSGNLMRYWNYGFNAAQAVPAGGSSGLLAQNATCTVDYQANATGRNGVLFISLTLTSGGESVTLFNQIHVDNTP